MIVYTGHESYSIPDRNVIAQVGDKLQANNGFGQSLSVKRDGKWIGFCLVEEVGFPTVREWIAVNGLYAVYRG